MLSGDEDIRIGFQIAQSFGVRVHLVGIVPSRGSQSVQLLRESDTTTEWDAVTVSKFLSIKAPVTTAVAPTLPATNIPISVGSSAASPATPVPPATVTVPLDIVV